MGDALSSLKEELLAALPVLDLVRADYPHWQGSETDLLPCPMGLTRHEDSDDSTPSLSIQPDSGEFLCHGCGWKGTSILGYYTDVHAGGSYRQAVEALYPRYVRPIWSEARLREDREYLLSRPTLIQRLSATRGWTRSTLKRLRIGWCSQRKRTVIPIYTPAGLCVDIRWHDTLRLHGKPKMLAPKGGRRGDWFPVSPAVRPFDPEQHEIWVIEGEPDVVLGFQEGLNVVTLTGGVGAWDSLPQEKLRLFEGKDVILCLDPDKAGQEAAYKIAQRLLPVAIRSLKNVVLPAKDLTDYLLRQAASIADLRRLASLADYEIAPKAQATVAVPLCETSQPGYIGQHVRTDVLINGKHHSPQQVPKRLRVSCRTQELCQRCPCREGPIDYHVEPEGILDWLYAKDPGAQAKLEMALPSACKMTAKVEEWQSVEPCSMIPALSTRQSADEHSYVQRTGFYLGHGLEANQSYRITAQPAVHPKTKESVLLVEKTASTYDAVQGFELKKGDVERLRKALAGKPSQVIRQVAAMQAQETTHIYGRWDLHALVDLCFHSPKALVFGGTEVPKGSMEVLLLGDTRCGKGQVAEGLLKFYDLGQVVSGENISFMGLCGGAVKLAGDQFQISWGAIPLNHGRLVVIDEFSSIDKAVLQKLSRIRSEGVAELNKGGISASTQANTRLIWIANPLKGRDVASYSNGVAAIQELIGAHEDVARFDLALVVQKGEVSVANINRLRRGSQRFPFTADDLRKVVLWLWSRSAEHIVFTRQATEYILDAAIKLSERYSATIPLVQGENVRFKIAKLAAAVAARCFSTEDGETLKVGREHARCAVRFICHLYDKPIMGYRDYSKLESQTAQLERTDELDTFFSTMKQETRETVVNGMLSVERFTQRELQDWMDTDSAVAKKHAGMLVRCRATQQGSFGTYSKKPDFIRYLKELQNGRLQKRSDKRRKARTKSSPKR